MIDELRTLLERAREWPDAARDELFRVASEIETDLRGGYQATPAELSGIDRGLAAAARGDFAFDRELAAAFAKFRE